MLGDKFAGHIHCLMACAVVNCCNASSGAAAHATEACYCCCCCCLLCILLPVVVQLQVTRVLLDKALVILAKLGVSVHSRALCQQKG
jgi:hypothetical protein